MVGSGGVTAFDKRSKQNSTKLQKNKTYRNIIRLTPNLTQYTVVKSDTGFIQQQQFVTTSIHSYA